MTRSARSDRAYGKNRTHLVAGGAGFLGSHLIDKLLARGERVLCVDNFFTGRHSNLAHQIGNPQLEIIRHDVIHPIDLQADFIWNLACPASPPHYQHDPVFTMKTSVLGSINLLDLASRLGIPLFQASTSEVYGDPQVHPQTESYWGHVNPIGIRSCYDEGKRAAEALCLDFRRSRGTDVRVVRIFNTYGPRMHPDDGRVISNFIVQALQGRAITIYGDGQQSRSFCYVDDLVDGFLKVMDLDKAPESPINLGNPGEFTMLELAQQILALTGSSSKIEQRPLPKDDPSRRRPDISLARQHLGWEPKIALRDGLIKTIEYFKTCE